MKKYTHYFLGKEKEKFEHWVWIDDIFTKEELEKIIELGLDPKNGNAKLGEIDNGAKDTEIRDSEISFFWSDIIETEWIFEKISQTVFQLNKYWWDFHLEQIECLQFSVYNKNQHYIKHTDILPNSTYQRKLSFSLQLNDPETYKGGDLEFHYTGNPTVVQRKQGRLVLFPSFTLHQVNPVTEGPRYSLVGWALGPHFK